MSSAPARRMDAGDRAVGGLGSRVRVVTWRAKGSAVVVVVFGAVVVFDGVVIFGAIVLAFGITFCLVIAVGRDGWIGVGDRLREVAEDIGRVVVAHDLVRARDVLPGRGALRNDPAAKAARTERQVLVVVVDDHERTDHAEQARRRVLEALDQAAFGSLAAILEIERELVQRERGGFLVVRLGDLRLPGGPLVGGAGIGIVGWGGCASLVALGDR